jgi:sec-independent protein translocase protein TatA
MGILGNGFTGWHLIAILAIVILLFGAPKLPALAKSIGQSMKIFKNEIKSEGDAAEKRDAEPPVVYTDEPPAGMPAPTPKPADSAGTKPEK